MLVIAIQAADSQFASTYLSFTSNILQPNEVTDYLVRLVQPRLTAVGGVQKADILGGRCFAMRNWMKPDRMAALNISPAQVRTAVSRNNYLAAVGSTKGPLLQVTLTANTDRHTADALKNRVVPLRDRARGGDPDLANRSDVPDASLRVLAQLANAAGDCPFCRVGGGRRDRCCRKRGASHARRHVAHECGA